MPRITIVAGPNGAGKTLFARAYLAISREDVYVNADVIAMGLVTQGTPKSAVDALAARVMLKRIDELVAEHSSFVIETTLASRT